MLCVCICAAIPATAAVGAKLNADQLHKEEAQRLPIPKITGLLDWTSDDRFDDLSHSSLAELRNDKTI